ncbi:hypothetical protein [Acetobacter thailandicus]|uniref:hypothetical protein n=1 Tax=Acetobacter thailandicus TaxID=1502842 RepID=UPI001BAC2E00|nr:hypothetical protein [Acetobacter thailandicus]MBS0986628.1 hypothetical protein [Acetobacter thailandicus]
MSRSFSRYCGRVAVIAIQMMGLPFAGGPLSAIWIVEACTSRARIVSFFICYAAKDRDSSTPPSLWYRFQKRYLGTSLTLDTRKIAYALMPVVQGLIYVFRKQIYHAA